jgi:threonine dehydrogenase-like Zn-dependent dehydrogenase
MSGCGKSASREKGWSSPDDEAPMTKSETMTKHEFRNKASDEDHSSFRVRDSFAICHLSFVIRSGMRATVVSAPGKIDIIKAQIPQPKPNQLLVKLEGCGVCASNGPPWEGKPWFTYPMSPGALGHEGWGRVTEIGSAVQDFKAGDRVAILSHNAYAEYDACDSSCAVKLPKALDDQPFPGEPLGCAMNIFHRSNIEKDHTVAIVGIGFLGALLTQLAAATGARVIAVSRRGFALSVAKQMGATETVAIDDAAIQHIRSLTNDGLCDVVIECTGKQWPLDVAGEITRERGRLVIAGYHQDGSRQINMQLWNWRGLDVINAHERDPGVYVDGIRQAVRAVEAGLLDPKPLYTHSFSIEQLADAMNMMTQRPDGFVKALMIA